MSIESQIRAVIEDRIQAIREKDADALMAPYAAHVATYDVINPLKNEGHDAVESRVEQWLSSFDGTLEYEIADLAIAAGEDVAFCRYLSHVHGTNIEGNTIDMWWRTTIGFERPDGHWTITHEHDSVPFDMTTGQASLSLKP